MRARLPRFSVIMSLLSMFGCETSTKELPPTAGELRATVEVEDLTSPNLARRSVRAVISNAKGKALERDDLRVEMNGVPMRFRVSQGNYYDRHPYYTLNDDDSVAFTPGTELKFVLIMPDSTRHDIGTVPVPAALSVDQFDFGPKPPLAGPVAIAWRDLAASAELTLGRTEQRKEADGTIVTDAGSADTPEPPRRTIGPGALRRRSDRWVIPEHLLVSTPERKLLWLSAEIVSTSKGKVSRDISKQSSLTSTRRIQLMLEFAASD